MDILLLNQAFYPDVAATAQYAADLAVKLVERGHRVTVIASRRGYADPKLIYRGRKNGAAFESCAARPAYLGKAPDGKGLSTFLRSSLLALCGSPSCHGSIGL